MNEPTEKAAEPQPKSKKGITDYISIKETLILIIGIIVIFGAISIIPSYFKSEPKTILELHIENYNIKPSNTNYVYNNFSFLKLPDPRTSRLFWYTQYKADNNVYDLPMHYGPKEIENISTILINPVPEKNFSGMYITIDPENDTTYRPYLTISVAELTEKFNTIKKYPLFGACTKNETSACKDREIVNCTNNEDYIVMYFQDNTEPGIIIDGNCFTIHGTNETLVQATDKAIYLFLGIIE